MMMMMKCPKSGIFINNNGRGDSGKAILQDSINVFWALSKYFSGKDGLAQPPPRKNGPYAYAYTA